MEMQKKNMARMSDILAVYAWVDPMTGYCQGMSDLLSPFIVLFEDDADAFWCFESLLRRMRPNFQMEGPIGVMKQLEALGRILQLTDLQLFKHLAQIGAESLLFAFRMLAFFVVLFALILVCVCCRYDSDHWFKFTERAVAVRWQ